MLWPPRILPRPGSDPPDYRDIVSFFAVVLIPWLAIYEFVLAIGIPPHPISGMTSFEDKLPVIEWTWIPYVSTYLIVTGAPFIARSRDALRRYAIRGLWTMAIGYPSFLLIPLIAPKRPFVAQTVFGRLIEWHRTMDSAAAAFPSFHVTWILLATAVFADRWPRLRPLCYPWAALVCLSCITTSQHSILDVLGGLAVVALVSRAPRSASNVTFPAAAGLTGD